jgi:hypothetical protein
MLLNNELIQDALKNANFTSGFITTPAYMSVLEIMSTTATQNSISNSDTLKRNRKNKYLTIKSL